MQDNHNRILNQLQVKILVNAIATLTKNNDYNIVILEEDNKYHLKVDDTKHGKIADIEEYKEELTNKHKELVGFYDALLHQFELLYK